MANVVIPYDDFQKLSTDSADKASVVSLLNTTFPDDTCKLVAIKAVLGITETTTTTSGS